MLVNDAVCADHVHYQPVEETVVRNSVIIEDPMMTARRSVMSAASVRSLASANANARSPAEGDEEQASNNGQQEQQQQQQAQQPPQQPPSDQPPPDSQMARTHG